MMDTSELPPNERPKAEEPTPVRGEPVDQWGHTERDYGQMGQAGADWNWEARRKNEGLSRFFWPALLVLAGFIFLAENLGVMPGAFGADGWDWMMVGAGALLFGGQILRMAMPSEGEVSVFWMIGGIVLMGLGLSDILALNLSIGDWWPVILIVLGISALAKGMRRA